MLKERLNRIVIVALNSLRRDVAEQFDSDGLERSTISSSGKQNRGDFSSSVAFTLASVNNSQPLLVAKAIARSIEFSQEGREMIEELMVAPPGYLNFRLRKSCLVQVLTSIHKEKHLFGHGLLDKAQQVSLSSWRKGAFNGNQLANGLNSEMIGPTSRRDPASFMGYVQGRCDSLIRLIQEESFNSVEAKIDPPLFNEDEWQSIQKLFATEGSVFEPALDIRDQAPASSRTLVVRLDGLPVELKQAVLNNDPSRLIRYAFEVASDLEEFRQSVRFYTEEKALLTAKLGVLTAGQQVLSNCLKLVGAANPE